MSEPKRHHYLPRFYLGNFTDPSSDQLWVRSAKDVQPVWRRRGTRAVAYENNFYSRTSKAGEVDNTLEKNLSKVEDFTSKTLAKVLRAEALTPEDRSVFATFVADLATRVPLTRRIAHQRSNKYVQEQVAEMRRHYAKNPEQLEAIVQKAAEEGRELSPEKLLTYLDPSQYQVEVTSETAMNLAMGLLPVYASILFGMGWVFFYSDTSTEPNYFITSDCPVCSIRPRDISNPRQGLLEKDIEISLPLSRNMLFLAWRHSEGVLHADVGPDNITAFNARATLMGKRFLIAPSKQFPGSDRIEDIWRSTRIKVID